jgi:N-acyl homoserine lactone hydrolase
MHAEPQPVSLPLPGGHDGATVRLRPFNTATLKGLTREFFDSQGGRLAQARAFGVMGGGPRVDTPVPAFLVEHPGAGLVLVDVGLHPSVAVDPKQNFGRLNAWALKPEMTQNQAVPARLRALGFEPSSVRTILMTHLHVDHASAMSEFPAATFLFAEREWAAASEGGPRDGYIQRQYDHAFDYRIVDFEGGEYVDSFATFGRAIDVFGDGSVRCVYTPGHTLGHMSVVLRLRGREALIAGDAAYTRSTLANGDVPYQCADEHLYRRSLREVQIYEQQTPDALVIPGHDQQAITELDELYE